MHLQTPSTLGVATGTILLVLFSACSKSANPPDPTTGSVESGTEAPGSGTIDSGATSSGVQGATGPCGQGGDANLGNTVSVDTGSGQTLFEPAALPNVPLDGVAGALTLFASTLTPGTTGLALYAGICNVGEFPMCSAVLQLEFYDRADQLVATLNTAVQSGHMYRLPNSETTISCVPPGHMAMAAATSLPAEVVLDDLKSLGHRFPAFQVDGAVLLPGATVSKVEAFDTAGGTAFRGTLTNTADATISAPSVSVFPVNGVWRPLGVATSAATLEVPPGGTWSFETGAVVDRGVEQVALGSASFVAKP